MINTKENDLTTRLITVIIYLAMVGVNAIASVFGINGLKPGEVSDKYENLFAPIGLTFSIWAVIYTLLFCYIIWQFFYYPKLGTQQKANLKKLNILFIISSTINIIWIFLWHFELIGISFLIISLLFLNLLLIKSHVNRRMNSFVGLTRHLVNVTFTIYFGWITVASIANFVTLMTAVNGSSFGLNSLWNILLMVVGASTIIWIGNHYKDNVYLLTGVWAYTGIILKHISANGFNKEYVGIIVLVSFLIFFMLVAIGYNFINKKRLPKLS